MIKRCYFYRLVCIIEDSEGKHREQDGIVVSVCLFPEPERVLHDLLEDAAINFFKCPRNNILTTVFRRI